jgi:type III restriction enzyme
LKIKQSCGLFSPLQRLTEGWDVLNLFDIVRMYEGQNSGGANKGKSGSTTTSKEVPVNRKRCALHYPFLNSRIKEKIKEI